MARLFKVDILRNEPFLSLWVNKRMSEDDEETLVPQVVLRLLKI